MKLKNINSFNDFKRINEAIDDFTNSTKFKESLVGRATYSLIRYFKKGVDLFRLEFFKRKYENELFAGILRYLATNPDLSNKMGLERESTSNTDSNTDTNDSCEIKTQQAVKKITNKELEQLEVQEEELVLNTYKDKLESDKVVISVDGGKESIEQINKILQMEGVPIPTQQMLKAFREVIQRKINAAEQIKNESYDYDYDDLLTEKVGSSLNKMISIKQIYGDKFVGDGKFKDFNIDSVPWEDLVAKCKENPKIKDEIANLVNKQALIELQKAVARIIYHTKGTPSHKGLSPETGGGIDATADTVLRNKWERTVNNTLSLFQNVMTIDSEDKKLIVNPFRLISVENAYKGDNKGENEFKSELDKSQKEIEDDILMEKLGGNSKKPIPNGGHGYMIVNDEIYFIIRSDSGVTVNHSKLIINYMFPLKTEAIKTAFRNTKIETPICKNYLSFEDKNLYGKPLNYENNLYVSVIKNTDKTNDQIKPENVLFFVITANNTIDKLSPKDKRFGKMYFIDPKSTIIGSDIITNIIGDTNYKPLKNIGLIFNQIGVK